MTYGDGSIERVLIGRDEIAKVVKAVGEKITRDYRGKELVIIGVLKGAFVFLADLIREIDIPLDMDFIAVSSYGSGTDTSGVVRLIKDVDINISQKHVLIVEDIVDTGLTINHLRNLFSTRNPKSIKVCTIFDKPSRRVINIDVEYRGIEIPNEFVIGYGLDYGGKYRNLPDLCVLKAD